MIQTHVLPPLPVLPLSPPKPRHPNPVHTDLITGTKLDWRTRSMGRPEGTRLWTSVCTLHRSVPMGPGGRGCSRAAPEWGNTVK